MKYPKFTRAENKACKYTEEEIESIKAHRKEGLSLRKISLKLNIPLSSVRYHLLSQEEKDEFNKMKYIYYRSKKSNKDYNKDIRERKWEKLLQYGRQYQQKRLQDEEVLKRKKDYMKKYTSTEEYKEKRRKYWKENYANNEEYKKKRREQWHKKKKS